MNEIIQEINNENDKLTADKDEYYSVDSDNDLYKKLFHDSKKSSIQDQLLKKFHLDISIFMGERVSDDEYDRKQRYDCMRLLKLLYKVEKFGNSFLGIFPKKERSDMRRRIPIIDVLSKPHFANINAGFPYIKAEDMVSYYTIIDYLIDEIAKGLKYSDQEKKSYENKVSELDYSWVFLTSLLSFESEEIKNNDAFSVHRLDRIKEFVENAYLGKIKPSSSRFEKETGILLSFYNYLVCHKLLCIQAEIIYNRYNINNEPNATEEYTQKFLGIQGQKVKISEIVTGLTEALKPNNKDEDSLTFWHETWDLITYGKGLSDIKTSKVKYCIGKIPILIEWINHYINSKNDMFPPLMKRNQNEITRWEVIAIMQELIYSDWHFIIPDGWFGNKNKNKKSLGSALKEHPDQVTIQAWIFNIENRMIINLNAHEYLEKRRELEYTFYKLKKLMFSAHKYEDMKLICDHYMHFIKRFVILSEEGVQVLFRCLFENHWKKHMTFAKVDNVGFSSLNGLKGWRILALEFPPDKLIPLFRDISKRFYALDKGKSLTSMCINVPTDGTSDDMGLLLWLTYDKDNHTLIFDNCIDIMTDDAVKRLNELGYRNAFE